MSRYALGKRSTHLVEVGEVRSRSGSFFGRALFGDVVQHHPPSKECAESIHRIGRNASRHVCAAAARRIERAGASS